jgi:hypothetical protein
MAPSFLTVEVSAGSVLKSPPPPQTLCLVAKLGLTVHKCFGILNTLHISASPTAKERFISGWILCLSAFFKNVSASLHIKAPFKQKRVDEIERYLQASRNTQEQTLKSY